MTPEQRVIAELVSYRSSLLAKRQNAFQALDTAYPDFNPYEEKSEGHGSNELARWQSLVNQVEFLDGLILRFEKDSVAA